MSSRELFMTVVRVLNLASPFTCLVLSQHNYVVTVITPIESPRQVKHSKQITLLNIHETLRMHPSFYAWGNLSSVILSNLSKGTHNNRRTGTPIQIATPTVSVPLTVSPEVSKIIIYHRCSSLVAKNWTKKKGGLEKKCEETSELPWK